MTTRSKDGDPVAYALALLERSDGGSGAGWDDIVFNVPVPHALDLLAEEYLDARTRSGGMDPYLVRTMVQTLINAARFDKANQPRAYDPDGDERPLDPVERVFRYRPKGVGRPKGSVYDDQAIAYTVGAVMARFGLPADRNPERVNPGLPSAYEVVAEAQRLRRLQPSSARGVRAVLDRKDKHDPEVARRIDDALEAGKSEAALSHKLSAKNP